MVLPLAHCFSAALSAPAQGFAALQVYECPATIPLRTAVHRSWLWRCRSALCESITKREKPGCHDSPPHCLSIQRRNLSFGITIWLPTFSYWEALTVRQLVRSRPADAQHRCHVRDCQHQWQLLIAFVDFLFHPCFPFDTRRPFNTYISWLTVDSPTHSGPADSTVAGTTMTATPELLCISFYVYESPFPQFMESPLHAGTGTAAQRRHGTDVHRADIPAATAKFRVAVDCELNRSQTATEQSGAHGRLFR